MTPAQYLDQLAGLLPKGLAWTRDRDATLLKVLRAIADQLGRADKRAEELLDEADPRTALEILDAWEAAFGLPETCTPDAEQTLQERRDQLLSKMTTTGGQSRAYFVAMALALGYEITITEFRPFRAGWSNAGDDLTNDEWTFAWRVNAPETTIREFRAGRSTAGEPLRTWGNELLECVISKYAPAHTHLFFGYGG